MRIYSAAEAAAELQIDSKTLRRLVRGAPSFHNAGSGGRYEFRTSDLPALRKLVEDHNERPKGTSSRGTTLIPDAPGLPIRVARTDPAAVKKITEERVDRLEAALRATGKHISQMRDRATWQTQEEDAAAASA